jgi:hypothetical protein
VVEIRCDSTSNNGHGHLLARINGDVLEIYCVKCKTYHAVPVARIVADAIRDAAHVAQNDGDKRLLW